MELYLNMNEGLDLNDDGLNYMNEDGDHGGNLGKLHGLDLNKGFV